MKLSISGWLVGTHEFHTNCKMYLKRLIVKIRNINYQNTPNALTIVHEYQIFNLLLMQNIRISRINTIN